jgi:hypothetical protein
MLMAMRFLPEGRTPVKLLLIISNILSLVVIAVMMRFQVAEHQNIHERFASIAGWAKTVEDRLKAQTADTTLSRLNEQDERNKAFAKFDTSVTKNVLTQGKWNDVTDANIGKLNDRLNTTDQRVGLVDEYAKAIDHEVQINEQGDTDRLLIDIPWTIKVNASLNKLSGRVDALEHPLVAP